MPTNRKATKKWYGQNRTCRTGRAGPCYYMQLHPWKEPQVRRFAEKGGDRGAREAGAWGVL